MTKDIIFRTRKTVCFNRNSQKTKNRVRKMSSISRMMPKKSKRSSMLANGLVSAENWSGALKNQQKMHSTEKNQYGPFGLSSTFASTKKNWFKP